MKYKYVFRRGTTACNPALYDCNQEVTACFTLAAVTNRLSSKSSLMGTTGWKSLGFILPTGIVTSYDAIAKHVIKLRPR
jgi:hypothetical protein